MPVETTDTTSRNRYVRLTASPFVKVADVLAFAERLREEEIPHDAQVVDHHAEDTRHLVGLSARVLEEQPTARIAPAPRRKP